MRWFVWLSVLLTMVMAASPALACPEAPTGPSDTEIDAILAEDQRVRDTAPREYMGLISDYNEIVFALDWSRWTAMSAADRDRYRRTPHWAMEAWLDKNRPGAKGPAYGAAVQAWLRQGNPLSYVTGFGHAFIDGKGTCSGYAFWDRVPFHVDWPWWFTVATRMTNAKPTAKIFGYHVPNKPVGELLTFVALNYSLCWEAMTGAIGCGETQPAGPNRPDGALTPQPFIKD